MAIAPEASVMAEQVVVATAVIDITLCGGKERDIVRARAISSNHWGENETSTACSSRMD